MQVWPSAVAEHPSMAFYFCRRRNPQSVMGWGPGWCDGASLHTTCFYSLCSAPWPSFSSSDRSRSLYHPFFLPEMFLWTSNHICPLDVSSLGESSPTPSLGLFLLSRALRDAKASPPRHLTQSARNTSVQSMTGLMFVSQGTASAERCFLTVIGLETSAALTI